jgi:hypothetical protein
MNLYDMIERRAGREEPSVSIRPSGFAELEVDGGGVFGVWVGCVDGGKIYL